MPDAVSTNSVSSKAIPVQPKHFAPEDEAALREALKSVLDSDFPNLVQLDVSTLAGVLAERLLEHVPYLDKVFFANSGAETVEAAIKFARAATGR